MSPQNTPIDGTLSLSQFIDTFLRKNWAEIYATLAPASSQGDLVDVSWPEFVRGIHRGAHLVNPLFDGVPQVGAGNVIAIEAVTDTLLYVALILAVIRSGNIVSFAIPNPAQIFTVSFRSRYPSQAATRHQLLQTYWSRPPVIT